jgi:hypothetical protein
LAKKFEIDRAGLIGGGELARICAGQDLPAPRLERVRIGFRIQAGVVVFPEQHDRQDMLAARAPNEVAHDLFGVVREVVAARDPAARRHLG